MYKINDKFHFDISTRIVKLPGGHVYRIFKATVHEKHAKIKICMARRSVTIDIKTVVTILIIYLNDL